jgi:gamma-glutamylcyclotransferase (GGCT)/AIG2-like uncharacterized protein YtfP
MSGRSSGKKQKVWLATGAGMAFNRGMNVFTYGSLMFEEVWRAVVGRTGPSVAGQLTGYEAWKLVGQTFPGLAPAPGRQVNGRIWQDVTETELARLDVFESGIYDRQRLAVRAEDDTTLPCWAYIVRPDSRTLLLNEPWDREEFERLHLRDFLSA